MIDVCNTKAVWSKWDDIYVKGKAQSECDYYITNICTCTAIQHRPDSHTLCYITFRNVTM